MLEHPIGKKMYEFQSTLPLRGATAEIGDMQRLHVISIHAPLAGSDLVDTPHDEREHISIHAPLAGSDRYILHC